MSNSKSNPPQASDRIILERTPEILAELRVVMARTRCDPVRLAAREALIAVCEKLQRVYDREPALPLTTDH